MVTTKRSDRDKRRDDRAEARRLKREQAIAKVKERTQLLLAKAARWKWLAVCLAVVAAIASAIYFKFMGI